MNTITLKLLMLFATFTTTVSFNAVAAEFTLSTSNNLSLNQTALPADDAFKLSSIIKIPDTIVLMWEIEEGYYLYRKSLQISQNNNNKAQSITFPASLQISDEFFGDVEVYYDKLLVEFPFNTEKIGNTKEIQLELTYQGCASIGYCYPIQQKLISLQLP